MAADYKKLTEKLSQFYDFANKTVIFVGAGGRQLLDSSIKTKSLIAIDQDAEALCGLRANVSTETAQPIQVICSRFEDVSVRGDVVYFEFCLHEMSDPWTALLHARSLASDLVVFDHSPGSDWVFHAAEEEEVHRSAESMERFGVRRREKFQLEQRFHNHSELLAKISGQGNLAIQRAERFANSVNIIIPMSCELVLL